MIGSQAGGERLGANAFLVIAAGVFFGAAAWGSVLCSTVRAGARFATPTWHIVTQGATAALMLFFAARTAWRLTLGA